MIAPSWLWIPLTIFAAAAQTARNAAQRHLVSQLGTLGATLVRFLYGMPVLTLYLGAVLLIGGTAHPTLTWSFAAWVLVAAFSQMAGTVTAISTAMTMRPPKRSVQIPSGTRINEPVRTGVAINNPN